MLLMVSRLWNTLISNTLFRLAVLSWAPFPIYADPSILEYLPKNLKLSGFGTLGLVHNDSSGAGAVYNFSQKNAAKQGYSLNLDSLLGMQLQWTPLETTSVVTQAVARAGQSMEPVLRMAFLRQQLGNEFAVRGGRIRNPIVFDSAVNEIGYAYLLSRPPIALYSVVNTFPSIDGADLQWRHSFGNTAVLAQAWYGNALVHETYSNYNQNSQSYEYIQSNTKLDNVFGFAISASWSNLTLRASRGWTERYSVSTSAISDLNANITTLSQLLKTSGFSNQANQLSSYLNPYNSRPIFTSVGFDAYVNDWRLLGEWIELDSRSAVIGVYEGFHLSIAYSIDQFTPYLSYARVHQQGAPFQANISPLSTANATSTLVNLNQNISKTSRAINSAAQYGNFSSSSISVGVRWDFMENLDLKLQYDHFMLPNSMSPGNFAVSTLPINDQVNLFTLDLDFVF